MRKLSRSIMVATASLGVAAGTAKAGPAPATLYRPANIAMARANIARHEWAREIRDSRVDRCRRLYAFTPGELASLIPEKTPLVSGHCPNCEAHFASAELLDRGARLRCTGCRKTWACEDPDRSETWDVYGAMRSHRLRYVYLDIDSLGLAHVLTGDEAYARQAAAAVVRFAGVFRNYRVSRIHKNVWVDRPTDTWTGRVDGWRYRESLCVSKMLLTYDLTRGSPAFTDEDRQFVDEHLVRYSLDYFMGHFRGHGLLPTSGIQDNGHCWESIALAAVMLQDDGALDALRQMFRDLCSGQRTRVFFPEDGAFVQGTFSYASQLLHPLTNVAEMLRGRRGADIYADPACRLLRRAYTWPLETAYPDGRPAALNDSHVGTNWSSLYSQIAYYRFGDRRALTRLHEHFGSDFGSGSTFSLFNRPPEGLPTERGEPYAEQSRLLEGLRLGVLRHGRPKAAQTMAFLDYGQALGHHHEDFLNIGLWAKGMLMVTEMGYRWSLRDWSRSPLAHNLVVELGAQSPEDAAAFIWADTPLVQAIEAGTLDLGGRRLLCLVPLAGDECYLLDVFWAAAGVGTHTWAMHAASDVIDVAGLPGLAPADTGPLPARDAPAIVAAPLQRMRTATTAADVALTWRFPDERMLRTTVLGGTPSEVSLAECPAEEDHAIKAFTDAGIRRKDVPFPSRALVQVRRQEAVSCFAAVHEPFQRGRLVEGVSRLPIDQGEGVAVAVTFRTGARQLTDVLLQTKPGTTGVMRAAGLSLRGRAGVVRYELGPGQRRIVQAVLLNGVELRGEDLNLRGTQPGNVSWPES